MAVAGAGEVARAGALPIGILLVGVGGILLFIAFHNVPSNVTNFTGLIGWVVSDIQGSTAKAGGGGGSGG